MILVAAACTLAACLGSRPTTAAWSTTFWRFFSSSAQASKSRSACPATSTGLGGVLGCRCTTNAPAESDAVPVSSAVVAALPNLR